MDPFLTVLTASTKRKHYLSCGDITALTSNTDYDQACFKPGEDSATPTCPASFGYPRKLSRLKSPPVRPVGRIKSRSCEELVSNIDFRLREIKKSLAIFREQDIDFRKRIHSLSNSIDDLASSRSSLNTPSEGSHASDLMMFSEQHEKDDQDIEAEIRKISMSFSSEVLSCIPTIAVTCYKTRQASDPSIHETA